jgi:hypothetical protein
MKKLFILFMLLPASAWALDPWGEFIPEHGQYSTLYQSDWGNLGTAKDIWDRSPSDYTWTTGLSGVNRSYSGSLCELKNIARKVSAADKAGLDVLFDFRNCDQIVIENVAIWYTDEYQYEQGFQILSSKNLYMKNVYLRGAPRSNHIIMKGGDYVYISNLEIEGVDYTGDGKEENARGIYLLGGECKAEGDCSVGPYNPFNFFVIQNAYIHDFDGDKYKGNNPEAIGATGAGDGIVFNCYVEHWTAVNPGQAIIMQVSNRRSDNAYGEGHISRVERCIVNDGRYIKQGSGYAFNDTKDNHTIWANNIFSNLNIALDFKQDDEYFVNNTWLLTTQTPFRVWNQRRMVHFYNNLMYFTGGGPSHVFNKTPGNDTDDKRLFWDVDNNLYYGNTPSLIWRDANSSRNSNWSTWQSLGKDVHGVLTNSGPLFESYDPNSHQYALSSDSLARGMGSPNYVNYPRAALKVDKDFFGRQRSTQSPDVGAINYGASTPPPVGFQAPTNVTLINLE